MIVNAVATCGTSEGAVVIAERGNAMARQVVGNDEEGFVIENLFIAILQAASRNEYDNRHFLSRLKT